MACNKGDKYERTGLGAFFPCDSGYRQGFYGEPGAGINTCYCEETHGTAEKKIEEKINELNPFALSNTTKLLIGGAIALGIIFLLKKR